MAEQADIIYFRISKRVEAPGFPFPPTRNIPFSLFLEIQQSTSTIHQLLPVIMPKVLLDAMSVLYRTISV